MSDYSRPYTDEDIEREKLEWMKLHWELLVAKYWRFWLPEPWSYKAVDMIERRMKERKHEG